MERSADLAGTFRGDGGAPKADASIQPGDDDVIHFE